MSQTLDKSRFATTMTVSRYAKADLDDQGRPTRFNAKPFTPNQVVLETDDFVFVSRVPVAQGTTIPRLVNVDPKWTLSEQFATKVTLGAGGDAPQVHNLMGHLEASDDLDRALQAACDMGRWDVAFMMVLKVWDLGEMSPASVLWDRFPHASRMSVVSGGRLFVPGGLTKTVIENWWAWQGGYHCPRDLLWTDWDEYERVMLGIRNPFRLAGIPNGPVLTKRTDRPVAVAPPALDPSDFTRPWLEGRGVAYLANAQGDVLPYWFVARPDGAQGQVAEDQLAWGEDVRNRLASQMNLPVLIARKSSVSSA